MHALFHYFFDWYTGQIWPNIIASMLTGLLLYIFGFRRLIKLHRRHMDALHNHIDQQFAQLKAEK